LKSSEHWLIAQPHHLSSFSPALHCPAFIDAKAIQAVLDRLTRAVEKTPKAEGTINVTQQVRARGVPCVLRVIGCCVAAQASFW
jgi:hypothetical protein